MFKRFCLIIIALLCFWPNALPAAQKSVNVLILPFEINAVGELMYLQSEIPMAIKNHLEAEGAAVLELPERFKPPAANLNLSLDQIRQVGIQNGADFVIWGSMTLIGQQFSLDANILDIFQTKDPGVFSSEGTGLENLPIKVKQLAGDIILVLFERKKIAEIVIEGNQRIEAAAIQKLIKTSNGDIYSVKALSDDLKSVYAMGYFDDVRIEADDGPDGKIVVFRVQEKRTIRSRKT
jgi:outer membrane protein insertion porin family